MGAPAEGEVGSTERHEGEQGERGGRWKRLTVRTRDFLPSKENDRRWTRRAVDERIPKPRRENMPPILAHADGEEGSEQGKHRWLKAYSERVPGFVGYATCLISRLANFALRAPAWSPARST
jgi:hypothetical protein